MTIIDELKINHKIDLKTCIKEFEVKVFETIKQGAIYNLKFK